MSENILRYAMYIHATTCICVFRECDRQIKLLLVQVLLWQKVFKLAMLKVQIFTWVIWALWQWLFKNAYFSPNMTHGKINTCIFLLVTGQSRFTLSVIFCTYIFIAYCQILKFKFIHFSLSAYSKIKNIDSLNRYHLKVILHCEHTDCKIFEDTQFCKITDPHFQSCYPSAHLWWSPLAS